MVERRNRINRRFVGVLNLIPSHCPCSRLLLTARQAFHWLIAAPYLLPNLPHYASSASSRSVPLRVLVTGTAQAPSLLSRRGRAVRRGVPLAISTGPRRAVEATGVPVNHPSKRGPLPSWAGGSPTFTDSNVSPASASLPDICS